MPSDIQIAQAATEKLGIGDEHLGPYGHYKAKVSLPCLETLKDRKEGKVVGLF